MIELAPSEILAESFRIIEREIGAHSFSAVEWPVVRRMIHATGDLEVARHVCFHHDAANAGVAALRAGAAIVTDVSMVAAGINKQLLARWHGALHCYIDDPEVQRRASEQGGTRSYWSMRRAMAEVGAAVYVIGNAPTALAALCEGVRSGMVRPALIVALPVGFVAVAESKEDALSLRVPVIAVRGRRGGSAMAAAAVNALLLVAAEGQR
jgi:precorrin-8X/cobalt-precorrin-8 methylmutase